MRQPDDYTETEVSFIEMSNEISALTEHNRLLQLENEQLAKDKAELVEALTEALVIGQNFCDESYVSDFDEETNRLDKTLEKHKCN